MAQQKRGVKILAGGIDSDERGAIVTGFIAPESLPLLKVDDYQREELSPKKIQVLMDALRESRVPAVELGMRGGENVVEICDDGSILLNAPVFIVDGLQRVTAAKNLAVQDPSSSHKLQTTVHLNTTFEWELQRFENLNLGQSKVNGNITLRNLRHKVKVVDMLHKLSTKNPNFVLQSRVGWDQNMKRGELISAVTYVKVVGMLHSHIGPGRSSASVDLSRGLQKIMETTGEGTMQSNVKEFFVLVNECWGVQTVAFRHSATQLKTGFLVALAQMLSDHPCFWRGNELVVDKATKQKLGSFPMLDSTVVALSGQGGKSTEYLSQLLADHVNSGRRTRRLVRRSYGEAIDLG